MTCHVRVCGKNIPWKLLANFGKGKDWMITTLQGTNISTIDVFPFSKVEYGSSLQGIPCNSLDTFICAVVDRLLLSERRWDTNPSLQSSPSDDLELKGMENSTTISHHKSLSMRGWYLELPVSWVSLGFPYFKHPFDGLPSIHISRIAEALGLECIGWVFTSLPLEREGGGIGCGGGTSDSHHTVHAWYQIHR